MINPVVLALLVSASQLLVSFSFLPRVLAEDTSGLALYSGNVAIVTPYREAEKFTMLDGFEPGMHEVGVSAGGGISIDDPRIYTLSLLPKYGKILATFTKPRGALELELEPIVSYVRARGENTYEVGATIMLGYNLETGTKLVPFVHGGLGGVYTGLADIA